MTAPGRFRRRPESTADTEASALRLAEASKRTTVHRTRMRHDTEAIVGHYNIPSTDGTSEPNAITAAAKVISGPTVARTTKAQFKKLPWQQESWELRRVIGEFRFAGDRPARGVSKVRFFGAYTEPGTSEPTEVETGPPYDLSQDLFGDKARAQQMARVAAQHLSFSGESILVVSQDEQGRHRCEPMSTTQLTGASGAYKINDGLDSRNLGPDELAIRCWIPDPEQTGLPDCPARAVLPNAKLLRELTKHTAAQIESRLAGNGILFLPEEIEVLAGQGSSGDDDEDEMDPFVRDLLDMMLTAIQDRESAAALIPLIVKLPGNVIKDIKHLTFGSTLDPQAKELREEEIRRIALGMDTPPEALLGLGSGSNHWSAYAIQEDEVGMVVAPLAATICHALTVGWYQPALKQLGVEDWDRYQIWMDLAGLALRPDRSKDAQSVYDKGELSGRTLRDTAGFDDDDAPDADEQQRRLLIDLVKAQPALAAVLLPIIAPNLDAAVIQALGGITADQATTTAPTTSEPTDSGGSVLPDTRNDPPPATEGHAEAP